MQRRKFIQSTTLASTVPLSYLAGNQLLTNTENLKVTNELYEIRTYELKFRGNRNLLFSYLKEALQPALARKGSNHFMLFNELGQSDPTKVWVLISYPDANTYLQAQNLSDDKVFVEAAATYTALPADKPIYNRFESMLLLAFDGMKQMRSPIEDAGLFELRIYEGYSEDAVSRKIKMFNVEEIELFLKIGLHPVFFGDMLAGSYRPALTYMLNFKDMAERDANWKLFLDHPQWKAMLAKKEYANTVSNIRRTFLKPIT